MDSKKDHGPELLSSAEAAELLKCHPNTLRARVRRAELEPVFPDGGRHMFFKKRDVLALLEAGRRKDPQHFPTHTDGFPVIAIGTCAKGVEGLERMMRHLESDLGSAYIVVSDPASGDASAILKSIQQGCTLPVEVVSDGLRLEADKVYVAPPRALISLDQRVFKVSELRTRDRMHGPVDHMFTELARVFQNKAIAVLLLTHQEDGVQGAREVRSEGGVVIADETIFLNGHPIRDTNIVDLILPAERIGSGLSGLHRHFFETSGSLGSRGEDDLQKILILIHQRKGVDLTQYKPATIHRRILRRMALGHISKPSEYYKLLKENTSELDALYNDLLINVTTFFRDPQVFRALARKVLPALMRDRPINDPIRIWVPGCSGGEEVVSIAITILEFLGDRALTTPVQIFATDLNEHAIERARLGIYKQHAVRSLSSRRLKHFFTEIDGHYQVVKTIRDMCVFARHDLIKDPPFSNLDLISCQNLLIYLETPAQAKIMRGFHYGLKQHGFLILGRSETPSAGGDLFLQPDRRYKVYQGKGNTRRRLGVELFAQPAQGGDHSPVPPIRLERRPASKDADIDREVDRILITRFTPPSVVVDAEGQIVRFHGNTTRFLEHGSGKPTLDLLRLIRSDLVFEMRTLLRRARKERTAVVRKGIPSASGGTICEMDLEVIPFGTEQEPHFMVVFREHQLERTEGAGDDARSRDRKDRRIHLLEQELQDMREQMRLISQEFESVTSELQSANEEVVSSNEELQSINEELETSKEELQSINEEFATINEELQQRNDALRESEERLRLSVQTGRMGIWDWEIEKDKITWSDTLYAIHGMEKGEGSMDLAAFLRFIHPEDHGMLRTAIDNAVNEGAPFEVEFRAVRPGGEVRWLFSNATVVREEGVAIRILGATVDVTERKQTELQLRERTRTLEILNEVGEDLVGDRDLNSIVQAVTDAGRSISGAEFGAFFFNVKDDEGGSYMLYTLSGLPREAFANFPMPRNTEIFAPTFSGRSILRIHDVLQDARYGRNKPYKGMPPGHPPVRSYLSVPVISRNGEVLGGLFYGHSTPGVFTASAEETILALAAQAAMAIDNSNLYQALQRELEAQRQGRQALQASEELLRHVVESLPVAMFTCDRNGTVLVHNEALTQLIGSTPKVGVDKWRDLVTHYNTDGSPIGEKEYPLARALTEGKGSLDQEVIMEFKNGRRITALVNSIPMHDEQGTITGAIKVVVDISERKSLELEQQHSAEHLQLSMDIARLGSWSYEFPTKVVEMDSRCQEIHGVRPEEVQEDIHQKVVHPDDMAARTKALQEALDPVGNGRMELEHRIYNQKDGELRWVRLAAKVFFENGQPHRMIGTVQDITERKLAQEALRESEERFRMLSKHMDQMAWIANEQYRLIWMNERWFDFTGLGMDEIRENGGIRIYHPDDKEQLATLFRERLRSNKPWEEVFRLRRWDGVYRWFLTRATPMLDAEGNVMRWFGTNTDITESKEAQEALRQADQRKDHFLATLAHELRSPLAPLRNGLELLPMITDNDEEVARVHAMMQRQLSHMVNLIDDLMDLSRISREMIQLRSEQVDLMSAAAQAIEAVQPMLDGFGHAFTYKAPTERMIASGDGTRITQMINNLLNNAAKYTPRNGRIELTLERDKDHAVIQVKDNGLGIPAEMLPRVFDMFSQVNSSKGSSGGGLGIGLHIVKKLVEMHKGTVEVQSDGEGKGSLFTIRLPLSGHGEMITAKDPPETTSVLQRKRIMVVDDNRDSASSLAAVLGAMGQETLVANDGEEAVAMAERKRPDLVFMDIGMPRMNGYEACKAIRAREWGRGMVIVALTGWGLEQDRERSVEAGFDHHLVKPVDRARLISILKEASAETDQEAGGAAVKKNWTGMKKGTEP